MQKNAKVLIFIVIIFLAVAMSLTANVKTKLMKYGDHKVYYEVRGKGVKTLVFIHGWTSSIQSWKYQLDSFSDYRVIAIDLPGNGNSDKHEDVAYTYDLFTDSIHAVLQKEKITTAFFIGHSMGFAVAEVMAVKYPDICAGIVSVDGAHFELPESPEEQAGWIAYNRYFAESVATEEGKAMFLNMLFLPDTPQILKDEVFTISNQVPLSVGKSMIEGVEANLEYWTKNKRLDIPCLAVYSPAYQLEPNFKTDLNTMYPQLEYHEIQGVSHFLMLEMPYKINQIIKDYLHKKY